MPHCKTFIQSLRDRGYRITPQREMIISIISHSGRHMTAEEIYAEIQEQTQAVNIATVYRVLDLLYAEGMVRRNDLGGGKIMYATTQHGSHIHLVCRRCGYILDAEENLTASLEDSLRKQYNFVPDLSHISLFGLCEECTGE